MRPACVAPASSPLHLRRVSDIARIANRVHTDAVSGSSLEDRVKSLIEQSGQTQELFGSAIELDSTKLSKSLNGHRRFTSLELARIADVANVSVDWLLGGADSQLAARVSADGSTISRAVAEAHRVAESRDNATFLGVETTTTVAPTLSNPLWTEQGSELAEFVLSKLGSRPDVTKESDSFALAIERSLGIDVCIASLDGGCDGLALSSANGARVLMVATTGNPTRQRFTMAHELAHLLCQDDQELHIDNNVMAGSRGESSEIRANAFAAALLMPEPDLEARFASRPIDREAFSQAVMDLMVSPSSLAWRLNNLKIASAADRAEFGKLRTIDCAAQVDRMDEYARWVEASSQPRPPIRLMSDLLRIYSQGASTLRPLANLLEVSVDVLREALEPVVEDSLTSEADDFAP